MPILILILLALGAVQEPEPDLHATDPATEHTPAQPAAAPLTVPFNPATGHILLRARLGEGPARWMILDTGNQHTTIFQSVADELGLDTEPLGQMGGAGSGSITVRRAADLAVTLGDDNAAGDAGDATNTAAFTDPMVTVLPDAARLPPFDGVTIDGFLGASLIERHIVELDYAAGRLTLHDPATYHPPASARIATLKLWHGFPYFEGAATPTLMGEPTEPVAGHYLLDLGATYAVDIDHAHAQRLGLLDASDPAQRTEGTGQGIDGVPFEMRSAPAAAVEMGGLTLNVERVDWMTTPGGGPPIPNLVGNVGSGAFPGHTVTLDYAGGRLILSPAR